MSKKSTARVFAAIGLLVGLAMMQAGCARLGGPAGVSSTGPATQSLATPRPGDGITESMHRAALAYVDAAISRVDEMTPAAEAVADKLLAGGKFYLAGNPGFCEEADNRAGGFAFATMYANETIGPNDVVLVGRFRLNDAEPFQTKLVDILGGHNRFAKGTVVEISSHQWPQVQRQIEVLGDRRKGLYMIDTHAPAGASLEDLCLQQFATVVTSWVFQGEVMAAATRKGRMLAVFPSSMQPNTRAFEDSLQGRQTVDSVNVPPLAPGKLGRQYLQILRGQIGEFLSSQPGQVRLAARRMAACMKRGGMVWLVTAAHVLDRGAVVPPELDRFMRLGRSWQFENMHQPMTGGDILLWIGYLDYPTATVALTQRAHSDAVVVSVADGPTDEHLTEIRSCWQNWDTVADVPNYPCKVLPTSGAMQTLQYYSIVAETAAVYGRR